MKTSEWPNIYVYDINLSLTYFCRELASHVVYTIKPRHPKNEYLFSMWTEKDTTTIYTCLRVYKKALNLEKLV